MTGAEGQTLDVEGGEDWPPALIRAHFNMNPREAERPNKAVAVFPPTPCIPAGADVSRRPNLHGPRFIDRGEQSFSVFKNAKLYMIPAMHGLIEIEEGKFIGDLVGACNPDVDIPIRKYRSLITKNTQHLIYSKYPVTKLYGEYLIPFREASTFYFHFMCEAVQNVYQSAVDRIRAPIIVPKDDCFFYGMSRETFYTAVSAVKGEEQFIVPLATGIYRVDTLVVPDRVAYGVPTFQPKLVERLGFSQSTGQTDGPRVIYIARHPGLPRAVNGQDELVAALDLYFGGLQVCYLEHLTLKNQIDLFRNAEIVIGPHGSGLTNIIFCNSQATIVEFHLPDNDPCYSIMTAALGLDYFAYVVEPKSHSTGSNYDIDAGHLISALREVGVS